MRRSQIQMLEDVWLRFLRNFNMNTTAGFINTTSFHKLHQFRPIDPNSTGTLAEPIMAQLLRNAKSVDDGR